MNLLKADFFRLFKNKAFYILLGVTFAMPILTCIMFPTMTVEKIIFQGLDTTLFCTICGIMIALFVGKDYDNNTIRNKICYGEKRMKIMGVSFVETLLITIMFVAASVLSALIFGAIFCDFSFTADFMAKFACQVAILLAFSLVVSAVTMCAKSMKTGLVISLMVSVLLSAVGQMLPMLSVTNELAVLLCRVFYSTVSSNLINSVGGTYVYTSYMQGGSSATFNGMYLNSIIVAVAYAVIAVGITSFVAKRQSYK